VFQESEKQGFYNDGYKSLGILEFFI